MNFTPKRRGAPFFIHAGADDVGHLGPEYYRVAHQPKQIWEAKGGHTQAFAKEPREYERRVASFLDRALLHRGDADAGTRGLPRAD